MKRLVFTAGCLLTATSAMAQDSSGTPELTVYTYDSFVADWGPGPQIEEAFEANCNCDLNLVGVEDGAALLARVRLEGQNTDADIVLGLDTNLIAAAKDTGLFAEHGQSPDLDLPITWDDPVFLPYDWGYFAFVHDKDMDAPSNFKALADSDTSIVIQDPRSSTPGLGLLMWVKTAHGDEAPQIWEGLSDNIVTVTKGWTEAYGLFLEGEADMVLSYTTSPAYHLIAEEDDSKTAAAFDEGHYMQVEVAGKLASTDQPELADQFLAFMLTQDFQSVIPTTNWMYPAKELEDGLPQGFDTLIQPEKSLLLSAEEAAATRDAALDEWLNALSR
ncbi:MULTISPECIES: thiamine ABC transporter substrate binding subunit [Roseovarius]|uniref:thiamine ABC transporter substrate binding subunit n=1 Tax=Roseovarius TaxID=74030 RepID=UPI000CDD0125|nr:MULTISPECIES: thiamine ABC transporter substrate binding subunit [Roseovarius]